MTSPSDRHAPDRSSLKEAIVRAVRSSSSLMRVLESARELDLPDWLIVSGAVYQCVWNHITGRDPDYGVKDHDLAYFDASDLSYEAEDRVIRHAAAVFHELPGPPVEVRNQARVHLWFEGRFGEPYPPLARSADALRRFIAPAFAVGVRLEADDTLRVEAPFGLDDLSSMRVRPNPERPLSQSWERITVDVKERWPEASIELPRRET